eukprot:3798993-Alexandrium_andersonii.AAC.1
MCEAEGRLGLGAGDFREMRPLSRSIRWTPEGLQYAAGPRRAEQLVQGLLIPGSRTRTATSPGYKRDALGDAPAEPL